MHVLMLLRDMGLDPASAQARRALELVRDRVTWAGCGPRECDGHAFFEGELEPCINGQVAAVGAYFGEDVRGIIDRLLDEQLPDGGWNCEGAMASTHSSFNTTICVLETLLEYERSATDDTVRGARLRGQEYLLERIAEAVDLIASKRGDVSKAFGIDGSTGERCNTCDVSYVRAFRPVDCRLT